MANLPPYRGTGDDTGAGHDGGSARKTARWMPILAISVAVILVLLIAVVHRSGIISPGAH